MLSQEEYINRHGVGVDDPAGQYVHRMCELCPQLVGFHPIAQRGREDVGGATRTLSTLSLSLLASSNINYNLITFSFYSR